jgi:asparagine synthase (glutamine-hydrolysing)
MCGILGWFSPDGGLPGDRAFLAALDAMAHRGPDGRGHYRAERILLGHVRLSILDPSHGAQPWIDPQTGVAIVYNGELYNYLEERETLVREGHAFSSHCDTEVLLRLYLQYGRAMLDRLNGMFAFAIHDPRDGSLLCARDHAGIKPFYFQRRGRDIVFASEIKAMVALGGDFEADHRAVSDYIHLQYVLGEKTFFKGVSRLEPGHFLVLDADGRGEPRRYFSLEPEESFPGGPDEAGEELQALLDDAVRLQLRSDVPLGAHLSGGLDTGTICALAAARLAPNPLHTFTAGFSEGGIFDDTAFAALTAAKVGSVHHEVFPTAADFAALLPGLAWHMDEPMAAEGLFPQYMVSRLARDHVKVVLGGQGADEIFGGYTRYYILLLDQALRNGAGHGDIPLGLGWDELGMSLPQLHNYASLMASMQAGGAFEEPVDRYWRMIDRSRLLAPLVTPEFSVSLEGYSTKEAYRQYMDRFPDAELLNRVLYFETACWLPALLHVEDRMSMAVSLESRVPFLDPRVMRFAFTLPTRCKMSAGRTKSVLRLASRDLLAPEILGRRDKLGFPVPSNTWFAGPLREFVQDRLGSRASRQRGIFRDEALESARNAAGLDRTMWGLLNLELWHDNLLPRHQRNTI